jgi:hypothetical protein
MNMKTTGLAIKILATVLALQATSAVEAAFTYTPISDSGAITVTMTPPLQVATASLGSLYGPPTITPIASGWKLTFSPSAGFFATANNLGGSSTQTFVLDGHLSFDVSFDSPVKLTTNIIEDGIYNTTGNAMVSVAGGGSVTPLAPLPTGPAIINGNLGSNVTYNASSDSWSGNLQITGFQTAYTSYSVSLDNILTAEAFAGQSFTSSMIAKKDFTLYLTTDGSSGTGVPEPASLSMLGLGFVAIIARRRRA